MPGASQWAPLFTANAAPVTPTPYSSALSVSAQAYVTGRLASGTGISGSVPSLTLAATTFGDDSGTAGCAVQEFNSNPQPAILIDVTFGDLLYGDPFPPSWTRVLSLCQLFTAALPVPNSNATANFTLVDSASVAPAENISLGPVVSIVQNPTINGASFFTAATLNTTQVPLSWSAPSGAAPYGYSVRAYVLDMATGVPTYNIVRQIRCEARQTIFDFAIIAFVLFMTIKFINRLKKPHPADAPPPAPPPKSEILLEEIRDLLAKRV